MMVCTCFMNALALALGTRAFIIHHALSSLAGPTVTGELQSGQLAVGVSFCLPPEVGWATSG